MARIGELIGPNGEVMHPKTSASVVYLEDGRTVEQVLSDDIDYGNVVFQDNSYKFNSDVEDDFAKTVVIKGQTYQNILPEPSTHVLTNNKETFKVNEGLDPNVEIVDGVSKSAILSGNTLVNVLSYTKVGGNVPLVKNGNVIEVEATTENTWRSVDIDFTYLKPNTKYIVTWDSIIFSNTDFVPTSSLISVRLKTDNTQIAGWDSSRNYIIATVPSDTSNVKLRVHASQGTAMINKTTVKGLKVLEYQEGMENWDIPYFEGMTSCKMPVLRTVGKNLFDVNNVISGHITESAGFTPTDNNAKTLDWFYCKPNTTYTVSGGNRNRWILCNANGKETFIGGTLGMETPTITTLPDTVKFRCYVGYNAEPIDINKVQLEEGDTATSHEPYKTNVLSTQVNLTSDMFEQGGVNTSTTGLSYSAVKTSRTDRIRVKELIPIKPNTSYYFKAPDGFSGWCNFYDENGLLLNTTSMSSNSAITTSSATHYAGIVLNKKDSSLNITPSEISGKTVYLGEEVVLRSLPNGVKDTLNLMTGEYVQRIKETSYNGSENWVHNSGQPLDNLENTIRFQVQVDIKHTGDNAIDYYEKRVLSSQFPTARNIDWSNDVEQIESDYKGRLGIRILKSKLSTPDINGFKSYLQANPLVFQYELATPIIKIVDLSSSGNWEKVVLDGSENWESRTGGTKYSYTITNIFDSEGANGFCDTFKFIARGSSNNQQEECVTSANTNNSLSLFTNNESLSSVGKLKIYLQSNPITVWYQTATHQDSTQVKQPIFFKDGHIQLSSGTDHSLIPTLDYQAKTSNSYVMDLMKANTRYTMKAKSASGTFTIDGTSYGAGTNGTFTTPSSMTNKLLVMSNKTNEEVMILEGDVVSKTIPYFKGIKSAFEDEDKIEVLSTGKNLFDISKWSSHHHDKHGYFSISGDTITVVSERADCYTDTGVITSGVLSEKYRNMTFSCKPNTTYTCSFTMNPNNTSSSYITFFDKYYNTLSFHNFKTSGNNIVSPNGAKYFTLRVGVHSAIGETVVFSDIQVVEGSKKEEYQSHKSNNTKIPLLSPLRSLPNGVCDEVNINREKNKATLIQRVGYVTLNGSEEWSVYPSQERDKTLLFQSKRDNKQGKSARCVSDRFPYSGSLWSSGFDGEGVMMGGGGSTYKRVDLRISKIKVSSTSYTILREYLSKNPFVVLYELETPVITEVDLEGFPYIYKEGHIFLNSEIAPTVGVEYSLNQGQRIAGQVETLQRHEKQFSKLEQYFADLVYSDYNFALLRFSEKLRQQEGDI